MKKKARVLIGCLTTRESSSGADNQTTDQLAVLFLPCRPFCSHTCRCINVCSSSPFFSPFVQCQDRNETSILLSFSSHRGNCFLPPSGRVYRPFLVQLNVSLSDSRPCLPGAPGSSVHRQLMANPKSEPGQLFPPKAAQMPPAAINTWNTGNVPDTQLSGKTCSPPPEKLVIFGGLCSQQERILK